MLGLCYRCAQCLRVQVQGNGAAGSASVLGSEQLASGSGGTEVSVVSAHIRACQLVGDRRYKYLGDYLTPHTPGVEHTPIHSDKFMPIHRDSAYVAGVI